MLSAHSGVADAVQRDHHRAVLRESLGPAARAMVDERGRSCGAGGARRVQRPPGVPGGRRIAGACRWSRSCSARPLAVWSAKSLTLLLWNNPDASSPLDLSPDYRVLGVMVGLVGLVAVCVSLLPASRVWSAKLTLMRGTRGLPGRSVTRWGRRLAAAQVALSVPLLVTAWIVAANLHRLEGVNTGFRPDGVIVASLTNQGGDRTRRGPRRVSHPARLSTPRGSWHRGCGAVLERTAVLRC